MTHIVYFLLLLFCTSINMIHGMDFEELTRLQENYPNVGPLSQQLLAETFPPKPATRPLIKTEPSDECSNTLSNALSNHLSSSSSSILEQSLPRALTRALTRKRKLAQKQSENGQRPRTDTPEQRSILPSLALMINTQSSSGTELPIPSDVEHGTLQPSSKQPLRKKRKVNKEDVPDNAYFTITCKHCFSEKKFYTTHKNNLIYSFNNHVKKKHSNITEEQTQIYIEKHLQEPELRVKFSIPCPESECKHIVCSSEKNKLRTILSRHIPTIHPGNKNNYSIESVAKYIENNYTKKFISTKQKLKKRKINQKDVPDNACFTITCDNCPHKPQFKASHQSNLTRSFKKHLKNKHSNITEKQIEIYIEKNLQKPELSLQSSVHCPEPECKHIACTRSQFNLKINLLNHIFKRHPYKKINYSKESVTAYVEKHVKNSYTKESVTAYVEKHVKNSYTKKFISTQKNLNPPDNAYFTITCSFCSDKQQFLSPCESSLVYYLKNHLNQKHPNMTGKETEIYIKKYLHKLELSVSRI